MNTPTPTQDSTPASSANPAADLVIGAAPGVPVVDLSIIEAIPNAGDLADLEVARRLSQLAYDLLAGPDDALDRFIASVDDPDALNVAADYADWAGEWVKDAFGDDGAALEAFLDETARELVEMVWPAYDPDDLVPGVDKDATGPQLVGTSLFWGFMSEGGIVTDEQASVWSALWFSAVVDPAVRQVYDTGGQEDLDQGAGVDGAAPAAPAEPAQAAQPAPVAPPWPPPPMPLPTPPAPPVPPMPPVQPVPPSGVIGNPAQPPAPPRRDDW